MSDECRPSVLQGDGGNAVVLMVVDSQVVWLGGFCLWMGECDIIRAKRRSRA